MYTCVRVDGCAAQLRLLPAQPCLTLPHPALLCPDTVLALCTPTGCVGSAARAECVTADTLMPGRLGPILSKLDKLAVFTSRGPITTPYVDGLPRSELVQYSGADGDTALAAGFDVVQGAGAVCAWATQGGKLLLGTGHMANCARGHLSLGLWAQGT